MLSDQICKSSRKKESPYRRRTSELTLIFTEISKKSRTPFQLHAEFTVLAMPQAPDLPNGPHRTAPVTCEFFDRCNPLRPGDHIGYLPYIHASAIEELEERGVE
jgi:hypothetical protein